MFSKPPKWRYFGGKAKGSSPKKLALNSYILKKLVLALPKVVMMSYYYKLYKSSFLLMYFACFRIGENVHSNLDNHCLNLDSIFLSCLTATADMVIVLNSYKHSKKPAKFLLPQLEDNVFFPKKGIIGLSGSETIISGPPIHGAKRRMID